MTEHTLQGSCVRGHQRTPANTYWDHQLGKYWTRRCRQCRAENQAAYKKRKNALPNPMKKEGNQS